MPRMMVAGDLRLPGKLTVRAGGRKLVLAKRSWESERHVLLKALVFGLYVDSYPNLAVELAIGQRYKPDLVAIDSHGRPIFWAECGSIGQAKVERLVRGFPATHLVIAEQGGSLEPLATTVRSAMPRGGRRAPVELLNFPYDAARHLGTDGTVTVTFADCEVVRLAS